MGVDPYDEADHEFHLAEQLGLMRARREAKRILDAEERPPAELPEILTLRERLARPRDPVAYRVEGWQPAGSRVVLVAQFKAGKTTLVGNLARVLVDGGLFLGRDLVTAVAGTVALIDFEMSAAQFDTWLAAQKIVNDDRIVVLPLRGAAGAFDILNPDRRAEWAQQLRERDVSYLVLDCLRPVLDALGLDEHHDAGRFLTAFDTLMGEAGIAEACIVHHMGHVAERSRGDSRIRDWPDVEWRLVRQDDQPSSPRYISAYGRDVDQPESLLQFDQETRHLTVAGGNRRDAGARTALDAVVELLRTTPGQSGNQIETALGGSHPQRAVRTALALGVQSGRLAGRSGAHNATVYTVAEVPQIGSGVAIPDPLQMISANSFPQVTESVRQDAEHHAQSKDDLGEVVSADHGVSSPIRRDLGHPATAERSRNGNGTVSTDPVLLDQPNQAKPDFPEVTESVRQFVDLPGIHNGRPEKWLNEDVSAGHGLSSSVRYDPATRSHQFVATIRSDEVVTKSQEASDSNEVEAGEPQPVGSRSSRRTKPVEESPPRRTDPVQADPPPATTALDAVVELLSTAPGQSGNQVETTLSGNYPRGAIRTALTLGVQTGRLVGKPGLHNATTYAVADEPRSPIAPPSANSAPAASFTPEQAEFFARLLNAEPWRPAA